MDKSQVLSVKEKIGYSLGDLAANLVFQTLITYLAYFFTQISMDSHPMTHLS